MLILLLVILVILVVAALFGLRWWTWKPVVKHRVMVQLADGPSLSGILVSRRGPILLLADVTVHMSGTEPIGADGTTVVERTRVMWMQVVS